MKKSFFLVFFLYMIISNEVLLREENIDKNQGEKWKEINFEGKKKNSICFLVHIIT